MLKFITIDQTESFAGGIPSNAYLIGVDGNPMRANIQIKGEEIWCDKRETGTAALVIQRSVGVCGELTVQTCLLPDREDPYLLILELARHQLMELYHKLEDWGMFDLDRASAVSKRASMARRLFVEALCVDRTNPSDAERGAKECLVAALDGCEELAVSYSKIMLERRQVEGTMSPFPIGCGVNHVELSERLCTGLVNNFDFIHLPIIWRDLAPIENEYCWEKLDGWMQWITRVNMPVVAGPVLSCDPRLLPDWVYIWEHDFDMFREVIYEHVERVVSRYSDVISTWNVVSGLHVNNHISFTFDQIMDLTRMATMLIKKIQPSAKVVVEICQPFGEYYSANSRSIPPLVYVDLLIKGAVDFDGVAIKLQMGQGYTAQYARDCMQVSNLLDQFSAFARPLAVTIGAPSGQSPSLLDDEPDKSDDFGQRDQDDHGCGYWRKPWSQQVQSHWLAALFQIALSKPMVDSVAWDELVDHPSNDISQAGLLDLRMQPKSAFQRLVQFRRTYLENGQASPAGTQVSTIPGQATADQKPGQEQDQ